MGLIAGLHHVNLTIPDGSLEQADAFYGKTLGLTSRPVPELQKGTLAWYDIGTSGQQVHLSFDSNTPLTPEAKRHPCFRLESPDALVALQQRVYEHHLRGDDAAPQAADKPGEVNSGAQGKEYPKRFFARDYAGNRLEFTL